MKQRIRRSRTKSSEYWTDWPFVLPLLMVTSCDSTKGVILKDVCLGKVSFLP